MGLMTAGAAISKNQLPQTKAETDEITSLARHLYWQYWSTTLVRDETISLRTRAPIRL